MREMKGFALRGAALPVCLSAAVCSVAPAVAQQTVVAAAVVGEVVDPTGARVAGALVRAESEETHVLTRVQADGAGRFRLLYLQPGHYLLRAESNGFAVAERRLELAVGASTAVVLTLGSVQRVETVAVRADAITLETNRSQQSEVVAAREFEALPFQGRNYLDATLLTPGVSATNTNNVQTFAETASVAGQGYSVNSQRNFSNNVVVDGLSANDDASGLAGNLYSLDAVQEVQVVTSGGQAEFGRALGGYVNVLTRSGSDAWHGTAFGLLRNRRLNAANSLSRSTLPLTQVQAGASLGGPLQRGRTFLFTNYEGRRLNTAGVLTIAAADAAAVNTRLSAVQYSGPRLAIAASGTTLFPTTVHTDVAFVKLDRALGNGGKLSGRWSTYQLRGVNLRGAGALADVSYGTALQDGNQTIAVSAVVPLGPHAWSETRAQYVHDVLDAPPNTESTPVVISGVVSFGRYSFSPIGRTDDAGELVQNVLLERRAHTIKMGADLLVHQDTIAFPQAIRGSYTFASLDAFRRGVYNTGGFTQSFGNGVITQGNPNLGLYAQDEWRLSPRLTLNLGARWDLQWLETIRTDTNNVSPRVGLAWSPRDGLVVRASGGLTYDRIPLRALANALLFTRNTIDPAQARLLSYTFSPGGSSAPVFPNVATAPPAGAVLNYTLMERGLKLPYAVQASLGVEQALAGGTVLGVSYQRVRGVHLLGQYNTNLRPDGTRPDPTRGNVRPYDTRFDSSFDGLEVSVRGQRPHGRGRISYVWSKAIDNVGEAFFSAPINNFDFGMDRARSDDDQRHRVTVDGSVFSGDVRRLGSLLSGWELGGVLQYMSRLPFTLLTGANTLQQTAGRPCIAEFYGTEACAFALRGAVVPRNTGRGFDMVRVDARLSRTVRLGEARSLNFAVQSFNVGNHRNDMIPNATFGTGRIDRPSTNEQFGAATAVGDARSFEVGVRYRF